MIKEAENIILSKEYYELTADELATVGEFVENAEEYEEMKWFLASTQKTLMSEKIEATPQLKKRVMDHLHKEEPQRKFWLNSVGAFLWPEDKEFYRKPAFQMGIAAILLIGILFVFDQPIDDQRMAVNDKIEQENDQTLPNKDGVKDELEVDVLDNEKNGEESKENPNVIGESTATEADEVLDETVVFDLDEEAEEEDMSSDDVIDLTHDGWYNGPAQPDEDAESSPVMTDPNSVVKSRSNATNNERPGVNQVSTSSNAGAEGKVNTGEAKETDRDENKSLNRTIALEEQDRRDKSNDKKKAKKEGRKKMKASFAYKPEVSQNQRGSGNLGGAEISNSVSPSEPVTEEISLADDVSELEEKQDILPSQFSVKSTPELNSLFTTFK